MESVWEGSGVVWWCKALLPGLGLQAVCCSPQMDLQMLCPVVPGMWPHLPL